MRFITDSADSEYYASKVSDTGGVYLVPAFTGLGAPWWDMYARGCIVGITRGTKRSHIIRAAQESIAYQVMDLQKAMEKDLGAKRTELKVDGGACRDNFLMQFQADISNISIVRPVVRETTALGAAYLAGITTGFWKNQDEVRSLWRRDTVFEPIMEPSRREKLISGWHKAIGRSRNWTEA
jgi:glycerol kinase